MKTKLFMDEWGVDMSLIARGGIEGINQNISKSERKIFLFQRKSCKVGANLGKTTGWIHRFSLRNKDVKMINGVSYSHIDNNGLHYLKNNQVKVLDVEHIVICAGQISNNALFEKTKEIKWLQLGKHLR